MLVQHLHPLTILCPMAPQPLTLETEMTPVRASAQRLAPARDSRAHRGDGAGATSPTSSVFGGGRGGRRKRGLLEGQGRAGDSILLECPGFSRARSVRREPKRAHLGMAQALLTGVPQPQPSPGLFFRVVAGCEHWPGPCLDLTLASPGPFTTEPRHPLFRLHPPSPIQQPPGGRRCWGPTPGIPSLPDSSSLAPLAP